MRITENNKNIEIEIEREIVGEYERINKKWLKVHFDTSVALVVLSHMVEILLAFYIINSDQLRTTIPIYILKFIVFPSTLNLIFIFVQYRALKSEATSQKFKIYMVSLSFALICFVLFTVHVAYSAVYFIFFFPIILTVVYADYVLTSATALLSVFSVVISELFIRWDVDKISIWADSVRFVEFIISLFILSAAYAVCMVVIHYEREKNMAGIQKEIERHELRQKLIIDELTGIYNRKALHGAIRDIEEDEEGTTYVFVMIDIDNFKLLNDTLGHLTGDKCLMEMGRAMTENCEDGFPFRFGGDEFCILFKNRNVDSVADICMKIQKYMNEAAVRILPDRELTVSIGIAAHGYRSDIARMVVNADHALYEAKHIKNAIHIYKPGEDAI